MYDDGTSKPDWDEAIQCYKKALLNDDKEAYGSLAWIYYNKGEFDEALHMAKRGRMYMPLRHIGFWDFIMKQIIN